MNGRTKLIEKWSARAKQYSKMAAAAENAENSGAPKDPIDAGTHYTLISDVIDMCATELSHLRE